MRFGVTSYLFALTGVLILIFEFLMIKYELSKGYHAASVAIALIFIAVPAIISSGSSLGAQVIKPIGDGKATLRNSDVWRNYSYVILTTTWLIIVFILSLILDMLDVPAFRRFSICAFVAFSPAILAYGRVLGSSWQALKQPRARAAPLRRRRSASGSQIHRATSAPLNASSVAVVSQIRRSPVLKDMPVPTASSPIHSAYSGAIRPNRR